MAGENNSNRLNNVNSSFSSIKTSNMKTYKLLISVTLVMIIVMAASAQPQNNSAKTNQKTESFKVWGKCEMCKARIEKAAKVEGVTGANWDLKTKILTVTYDAGKTGIDAISKKIASAGHDTEKYRAPDDVYAALPSCCHYERKK